MPTLIKVYRKGLDKGPRVYFHGDGPYAPIILTHVEYEQLDKLDKPEKLEVAIRKAN